ncbi:MAG TPA: hypothetical protein PKE39_09270 [Ignavibacteria bacterium]|nr:hypothetical protein [Ignavibacteria bacterium]HMQ99201.1 hypothetical protein [Ignavibacteria bacterium]
MDRIEVLLNYHNAAREECLLRVKWRDNWLRYQFIMLSIIISISLGIKIFGVEFSGYHPEILLLCLPLSVITCSAYVTEEFSIANLTIYLKSINKAEFELRNLNDKQINSFIIYHWDGTKTQIQEKKIKHNLKKLLRTSFIKVRFLLLIIAFVMLPYFLNYIALVLIEKSDNPALETIKSIISDYSSWIEVSSWILIIILFLLIVNSQYSRFKVRMSNYQIVSKIFD